jgi:hypothetical protein
MLFALPGYQIPYIVMNRCFYLTLQALSLVEKAEPVQVQASHYAWGTNGACECKMDVKSIWIPTWRRMDHVSWLLGLFSKTISWRWPNTKPGYHGTPNAHNCWFILLYHMWKHAWIEIHWNSNWLRDWSRMTSHYTWGSVTTLHDFGGVLGRPLDTFLLGSHNLMVTALGLCVKWPLTLGLGIFVIKNCICNSSRTLYINVDGLNRITLGCSPNEAADIMVTTRYIILRNLGSSK